MHDIIFPSRTNEKRKEHFPSSSSRDNIVNQGPILYCLSIFLLIVMQTCFRNDPVLQSLLKVVQLISVGFEFGRKQEMARKSSVSILCNLLLFLTRCE